MPSEQDAPGSEPATNEIAAIGSMEEQLISLYSERISLEREIGKSDAAEILGIIRSLNDRVTELETEQQANARSRRILAREFGTDDPNAIVSRLRGLNDLVAELEGRLAEPRATSLPSEP